MPEDTMPDAPTAAPKARPDPVRGFRLGRVFGIELRLDPSVLVILALVVASLGIGTLPSWHPGWSAPLLWGVALAAGVLLLLSIVLHELAHSVVAQGFGIPVPRITLFLFGGLSEMESEPDAPGQELLIALVGPLTSLAIGVGCLLLGTALLPAGFDQRLLEDPAAAMQSVGAGHTLLLWLGPVNVVLAIFNLIPGFPLDGGRVLRAALWKLTGDRARATTWAARGGQVVAFALMGVGVLMLFRGRLDGLWLLFIGWFLNNAARTSQWRMVLERFLGDLHVGDLMRTQVERLPRDMPLGVFIDDVLRRSDQELWPVMDPDGTLVGAIDVDRVRQVPHDQLPVTTVGDVAEPLDGTLAPEDSGLGALRSLSALGRTATLVVDHGEPVGLLRPRDIGRWLLVAELEEAG